MFTVKGNGIYWDPKANKALATFKNGEFKTEDKKVADTLGKAGYEVTEEAELPETLEK